MRRQAAEAEYLRCRAQAPLDFVEMGQNLKCGLVLPAAKLQSLGEKLFIGKILERYHGEPPHA
ncbi:MAG: hypothetical protein HY770_05995 [Chitinivibrionia bacterium]|nr:hypothetical protein [Chitinivibrionia bacterium]